MIYVYAPSITERIRYSFTLVFETVLNNEVQFYSNKKEFIKLNGVKINYSNQDVINSLKLEPVSLLLETHVEQQYPKFIDWEGERVFFETNNSFLPFDLFAASFFLVSRYEEYLPGNRDGYNRYYGRKSFAFISGILNKPVVNIWALKLADLIESKYEDFRFKRSCFTYLPTIDIDNAWAFKNKGIVRNTAAAFRDLFKGNFKNLKLRYSVLFRLKKDPFDSYDFIADLFKENKLKPIYFFLLNRKGKRDKSLSPNNPKLKGLIRQLQKIGDIGAHPSYQSNEHKKLLGKELQQLSAIISQPVIRSRQHYLKLSMPKTYRRLIKNGIKYDYTMGYPSRSGFKSSICTPYKFFDIFKNKTCDLTIYPFQVMDVMLRNYRKLTPVLASTQIDELLEVTASVGGTFVSIWHNESLSNEGRWKDWQEVYIKMTEKAVKLQRESSQVTS